jgi:hypothetical protein
MVVKVEYDDGGWSDGNALSISLDGVQHFYVADGEPEDNNLMRNFNDCYNVLGMLRVAYEAGYQGEPLEVLEVSNEGVD